MARMKPGKVRLVLLLFALFLAAQLCAGVASADEDLVWELPGTWTYSVPVGGDPDDEEGETSHSADLAVLTLEKGGDMSLRCYTPEGEYAYTCEGSWSLELTTEPSPEYYYCDVLTLHFTSTDNPAHAGSEYDVECVYYVYAESWVEDVTRCTVLISQGTNHSGVSPFQELIGDEEEEDVGLLEKREGPNMKVVNCKSYVSLREERSASSARLAKVPLGALVFAFPETPEENGFLWCVYQGEYGYILSEYLQTVR